MIDKEKRNQYWAALKEARKEYLSDNKGVYDLSSRPSMHYWVRQKYGIIMGIDSLGEYTSEYTVDDEKKFMLFQIKFWR